MRLSAIASPMLEKVGQRDLQSMSYDMHCRKYREYQAMQLQRSDGLRWDKGKTLLLSGSLSLLLFAFVFYDRPITTNTQIFSYLRGFTASLESPKVISLF